MHLALADDMGGLIVVVGLVGLLLTRNGDVAPDPGELPEQQTSNVEADDERDRGRKTSRRGRLSCQWISGDTRLSVLLTGIDFGTECGLVTCVAQ